MPSLRRKPKPQGAKRKAPPADRRQRLAPVAERLSRWFNRGLILAAVAVVAVLATQASLYLLRIPVEHIVVKGKLEHTQTEAVQANIQPALEGGFLQADLKRIRAQLQALPWIHSAQVRRRWPNALEIHVVEQLPIARWGEGGFLNHEGEVFHSERGDQWRGLPRLSGPEGSSQALVDSYQRLLDQLQPLGLAVESLSRNDRGELRAQLQGGVELVVGDRQFKERLRRFVALHRSVLGARGGDLARVDLRYRRGIAVEYREPAQVAGVTE